MKVHLMIFLLLLNSTVFSQTITTVAGNGSDGFSGLGGQATDAALKQPWDVEVDSQGNIYFSDQANNIVYFVDASTGIISNILGNGVNGTGTANELGPDYELTTPGFIYLDETNQHLYVSDYGAYQILKLNLADSTVEVVAGNGFSGYSADGTVATSAYVGFPMGLGIGPDGLLYFVEHDNNIIRKINASGELVTVAGIQGSSGYQDGSLSSATFGNNYDLEFGSGQVFYVADPINSVIRKIDLSASTVSTVCGTGTSGYNGDGNSATATQLNYPHGIAIDDAGNILIGDVENYRVRKLEVSTQVVTTIVGTGTSGYSGDGGDPLMANIDGPLGVDVLPNGDIYFADIDTHVVRKVFTCTDATLPSLIVTNTILDSSEICPDNFNIVVEGGNLNNADDWYWYSDSCGGTKIGVGFSHNHYLDSSMTFYVRGEGGCTNAGPCNEITIKISDCNIPDSIDVNEIITAFSPNDDGVNDKLVLPLAELYPQNHVTIYNRWGDVVKQFKDYDNGSNSWYGENQFGGRVGNGTYFYIFESDNIQKANWVQVIK